MRVLVACEFSGIVRDAFLVRGHDAWSCDLLPTEKLGPHIQGNVLDILNCEWDLIITHPPCTYLCGSGARWWTGRKVQQAAGAWFFMQFINCKCSRIAVENPIGVMSKWYRKPDQIIQPWMYGYPETKSTCLWLKNLPLLTPTKIVSPVPVAFYKNGPRKGQGIFPV